MRLGLGNSYVRNVVTLMTGTTLAQAIPLAISPILTRLYSPTEFGVFALYMAVVSIAALVVTGRYELAIILPKKDSDAFNIVALSMGLSAIVSGVLLVLVVLFNKHISNLLGVPDLSPWLYWIPFSTFLVGIYQSLNYWSNRKGQYKRLAASRVTQSGSASLTQLGGGYAGAGAAGLIGGQIAGQAFASVLLAWMIYRDDRKRMGNLRKARLVGLARKYSAFPKYLVVAHGINIASSQMPVMLLSTLFNAATAGLYALTQRVMGAPMVLVAGAIGDVFRQEASQNYIHKGNCEDIYKKTFKRLFIIAFPSCLLFFFISPWLFGFVFGQEWRVAGDYARILTPVLFFNFVSSPLSAMFMIAEKQRLDLLWQICFFVFVGSALFFGWLRSNVEISLMAFSFAYSVMFLINNVITYRLAIGKGRMSLASSS